MSRLGALLVCLLCAGAARGQVLSEGFALQPYEPSPVGDRFYAVRGASVDGHVALDAGLIGHFAYNGLLTRRVGDQSTALVSNQLYLYGGASLSLGERWMVDLSLPAAVVQNGDGPAEPEAAFGDIRLGGRFEALSLGPLSLAPILELWVPTGSRDDLTGDGLPRGRVMAALGGKQGIGLYGVNLGFLLRRKIDTGTLEKGPAFTFGAAGGLALFEDSLQLGAELDGQAAVGTSEGFLGERTVTLIGLGSIRYRVQSFLLGVAGGPGLSAAPGVSSRVLLSFAYAPKQNDTAPPPAPPEETTEPAPADPPPAVPPTPMAPPPKWAPPPPAPPPPPPPLEPAPTDPEDAAKTQRARELFLEGIAAYDAENYSLARQHFAGAYALRPHATVLLNLAESELAAGDEASACAHFKQWHQDAQEADPELRENARSGMAEACRSGGVRDR